jgi:hypothetical protein
MGMDKYAIRTAVVEKELDAHLRLLFNQARTIIKPSFDGGIEEYATKDFHGCVTAMISAKAEIEKTSRAEEVRLAAIHNCDYVGFHVEAEHIVASAVASFLIAPGCKEGDWSPYSNAGVPFIVFARAHSASVLAGVFDSEVREWEEFTSPEKALQAIRGTARDK